MRIISILLIALLFSFTALGQKGIVNKGALIVITSNGIINLTGTGASYTNQSNGSNHGRITLDGKIYMDGNWNNNAASGSVLLNPGTNGEVIFDGANAQFIGGSAPTSFEKLTINNTKGINLQNDVTVFGNLGLTSGLLDLGSRNLTLSSSSAITGTPTATNMIAATGTGEVRKIFTAAGSFTYPVGDSTGTAEYSPVILNFTSGTFNASSYAGVRLTNGKHPSNTSAASYLNRYWTITQSGITGFSSDASMVYTNADIVGTETNIWTGQYSTPFWKKLNATNAAANTLSGTVSSFSDFTGGETSAFDVSFTMSNSSTINEGAEAGGRIDITLFNAWFNASLNSANWTLTNQPAGVTIGTLTRVDNTHAYITLTGNRTKDYDANNTNTLLSIGYQELVNLSSGTISANSGVTFTANNDDESIAIASDGNITEGAENNEPIYVTLTGGTFVPVINSANWTLSNLPAGVTKGTVTRTSSTTATIVLSGNRTTDYDINITNLTLTIADAEVDDNISSISINTGVTFTAIDEPVTVTLTDNTINEAAEAGKNIFVAITQDQFVALPALVNWTFTNLPQGVTVTGINKTDATHVTLTLSGTRTKDYDADIINTTVTINGNQLGQHTAGNVSANTGVVFHALNDVESLSFADDGSLNEGAENGELITVTLTGGTFANPVTQANWTLSNLPAGVTKGTVALTSLNTATISLVGNRTTDYDANITNLSLTVADADLDDITSNLSISTGVTFKAVDEPVTVALSGTITEGSENGSIFGVAITQDQFQASLALPSWTVTNLPQGITVSGLTRVDNTHVNLTLSGARTKDYDSNISNTTVLINANQLTQHTYDVSANTGVTFTAVNDAESISSMADDGNITEGAENDEKIVVNLAGGTFVSVPTLANWVISGQPTGVTLGSVAINTPTKATLTLSGNSTVDYDIDITNMQLSINEADIDDYTGVPLTINTGVRFTAIDESLVITMKDDGSLNEGAENNELIKVAIQNKTFHTPLAQANWTLTNLPQGVSKGTVTRVANDTVTISLSGNRTKDFDTDITNVSLQIAVGEIDLYASVATVNTGVTIKATNDAESLTMNTPVAINETLEDSKVINVALAGGTYASVLTKANWVISNLPQGVSIGSVSRTDATHAAITLSGNRTVDYDANITLSLAVNEAEIDDYTGSPLPVSTGAVLLANNDNEVLSMTNDADSIHEGSENGEIIYVTLTGGTFANPISSANWTLTNLPAGVTKGSVTRNSSTTAQITLSGNRTADYDVNITNLTLTIADADVDDNTSSISTNTGVIFKAVDEPVVVSLSDNTINESAETGRSIYVVITQDQFIVIPVLTGFTLANLPQGVTAGSVTKVDNTHVTITLAGNRTKDYDTDIMNLSVTINGNQLGQHTAGSVSANTGVRFIALNDPESLSISDDGIAEGAENGELIYVTINGGTFANPVTQSNWTLTGLPAGVTKGTVSLTSSNTATIALAGNRTTDYDANITTMSLTVADAEIDDISSNLSVSSGVTFVATDEPATISISGSINESAENGSTISVILSQDQFKASLNVGSWAVSNLPVGVTVSSLARVDATHVTINLSGTRTKDYDSNISNITVLINSDQLVQHAYNVSANSGVVFNATNDSESLSMTDDGSLNEGTESGELITVTINGGTFANPVTQANWTLTNLPAGVSKGTVTLTSPNTATIALAGNRTTDYDADKTNLSLSIADADVDDITSSLSVSTGVTFRAVDEPVTVTLSDNTINEGAENGKQIYVAITQDQFIASPSLPSWTFGNLPQGVTAGSLSRTDATHVTLTLSGNRTKDYDNHITNVSITIPGSQLMQHTAGNVSANTGVTFNATNDAESISMSQVSAITEGAENGKQISVTLTGGTFATSPILSNWVITSQPTGVSIGSVVINTPTTATITLSGNRTVDYDADITNMQLSVNEAEVDDYTGSPLTVSTGVTFTAILETLSISTADDGDIQEGAENGEQITITLSGGTFVYNLDLANWTLLNLPSGVSKGSIDRLSSTQARITLSGYRVTDYDANITDVTVKVTNAEINSYSGTDLVSSGGITFKAKNETLTISHAGLTETNLNGAIIPLVLANETFKDNSLLPSYFILNNAPVGTTVNSVSYTDATHAQLTLAYDAVSNDFDVNINNFSISIDPFELAGVGSVTSNALTITAVVEAVSASIGNPGLTETNLDGAEVDITLTNERFSDATLLASNFLLNNAPTGLTIGSVQYISALTAKLLLSFNGTDFDADVTNFSITIQGAELRGHADVPSNTTTIQAVIEVPTVTISSSGLAEDNLDGNTINVDVTNDAFIDASLNTTNFILNNAPAGLTISSVSYVNPNAATITLAFNGTDFDSDISNLSVKVKAAELASSTDVTSNSLTLTAIVEPASLTISGTLSETNLDGASVNLALTNAVFTDDQLSALNFLLNNAPAGTSVDTVTYTDATHAVLLLKYDNTDFDIDVTNFSITVTDAELTGSVNGNLTSNSLTITSVIESQDATISHPGLTETNLNGATITLILTGETFVDNSLDPINFVLINAPLGTTVNTVTWNSSTQAEIVLNFNGIDFDQNITNFHVLVDGAELTAGRDIATNILTITAVLEPESIAISHPGLTKENLDGAVITLDLTGVEFKTDRLTAASFILNNAPTGTTIDSVHYVSPTQALVYLGWDGTNFTQNVTNFNITVLADEFTGLKDLTSNNLTIVATGIGPNPYDGLKIQIYSNQDMIYIKCDRFDELDGDFAIYNLAGQEIIRKKLEKTLYNTALIHHGAGDYIVRVYSGNRLYTNKVMIFVK